MITSRLRSLIRHLRGRPALHRVVARLDAIWWAESIRRAGVVDVDYVEAQLGRRLSERRAIRRYVAGGFRDGLRLNPFFVDTAVGDTLPEAHRVPALYAYLVADPRGLSISPAWDAVSYLERHPERADEPGGALGAAWRRRERDSLPRDDDSPERHVAWDELHRAILRAVHQARDDVAASVGESARNIETDLVLLLDADEWDFDESLETAVAFAASERTGVTIAQIHGRAEDWVQATVIAARHPRIRAARIVAQDVAGAAAELSASSSAPVLVWRGPNEDMTVAAMRSLADEAHAGAVAAPLWLDHDGTIAAAGATSDGRLLAAHPREDAAHLPGSPRFTPIALAGLTMAGPKELLLAAGPGRDGAALVGLTAAERGFPVVVRTDVITRSRAAAAAPALPPLPRGADAVLHAAGWLTVDTGPAPRLMRSRSRRVSSTGDPVYRWAIRTAAPVGPRAEWWGDVHFARSLAEALRRLGQEVVIDSYPARDRLTTHLDDVTLSLRGPEPIDANATGISILWVISHPEQIDRTALEGYDLVFAASAPWAAEATRDFDRPVLPLLQCTDAYRFRPSGLPRGRDVVFVGTARGIYRPSVVDPVHAGVPLRVFGPDWRGWIPASAIAGNGVPNAELPALYEAAAAVMNDHWPSMKDRGFIANRPYDVVAAGGRVISDDVAGIADTFQGAVLTYRDTDELLELLRSDLDTRFPSTPEMQAISELIRRRDSFDARARTLLDAVVATGG